MLSCEAFIAHNYCDAQFLFAHPLPRSLTKKHFFRSHVSSLHNEMKTLLRALTENVFFLPNYVSIIKEILFSAQSNFSSETFSFLSNLRNV